MVGSTGDFEPRTDYSDTFSSQHVETRYNILQSALRVPAESTKLTLQPDSTKSLRETFVCALVFLEV